jgi:Transposase domain (DUF772)
MAEQRTFAGLAWSAKGKVTRRERFLVEMNAVIPWRRLLGLIEPDYPKAGQGRQPLGLEKMLRIYFVQQWFDSSDPGAEDAIYDSESIRRFVGVELGEDVVPDESTILRFRHLLEEHDLTKAIFDEIGSLLEEKGLILKQGTIVDATIISAPSSTKNRTESRDPEMRQTKKGNTWHFGMKVHVGTTSAGLCIRWSRPTRRKPTSPSFRSCCMVKSANCMATAPIGGRPIAGRGRVGAGAIESIGEATAPRRSRIVGKRSTEVARGFGREASTASMS